MIMSLKQLKMKFKPGIKLNHNIHIGSDVNVLPAFYSIFKCLKALARLATAYPFWEFLQFFLGNISGISEQIVAFFTDLR